MKTDWTERIEAAGEEVSKISDSPYDIIRATMSRAFEVSPKYHTKTWYAQYGQVVLTLTRSNLLKLEINKDKEEA